MRIKTTKIGIVDVIVGNVWGGLEIDDQGLRSRWLYCYF